MASTNVNKKGPRIKVGGREPRSRDMLFGTDEEVSDRDPNTSLYSTYGLPNTNAPAFKQIEPKVSTGQSVNRAQPGHRSGDFKFSGGIGKP